jgi:hypothetical protein
MKYADGSLARLGDRVLIRNGDAGVIVFSVDTNEFSPKYPREDWPDVKSGVMVLTDKGALVRFAETTDPSLVVKIE